ncbi:MAG: dienelactone hydrolase family protein [bacterium]|nr:dienelactone hydrolase family protein [bacterium]
MRTAHTPIENDFTRFTFEHEESDYPVYRSGTGPGILIIHELPGMLFETIVFARRLRDAGFTVYMPLFFGPPGRRFSGPATAAYSLRLCVSREFYLFQREQTSPIVEWLKALCRLAHSECGGPGVGAIGMCLTGGFALPMLVEPSMLAPVLSQPSMPACTFARGADKLSCARALDCSPEDLEVAKRRVADENLTIPGFKFSHDRLAPDARFDRLREEFGEAFVPFVIDSGPGNAQDYPETSHAVFSAHYSHKPGTPTREAFDRLLAFYQERLVANS